MIKQFTFSKHCPTKDETVSLTVNYISAECLEDIYKTPFAKGTIEACTGSDNEQCSCECYSSIPDTIYK